MGHLFILCWAMVQRLALRNVVSVRCMLGCSVCDILIFSTVKVFGDYGGVYVFHVYGVGIVLMYVV